jgi:putative NADPH-quinone reductase
LKKRILIIDGHPDSRPERFIHALSKAYGEGARLAGHEVRTVAVGILDFPWLRWREDFYDNPAPEAVRACQESIAWADHIVISFPLWHGTMPALLKAFLEQLLRPGFAFADEAGHFPRALLSHKSARIIVTMGMPALVYRWFFHAHGSKSLQRSILEFCGIKPVRTSLIGMVEGSARRRTAWLARIQELGRLGR